MFQLSKIPKAYRLKKATIKCGEAAAKAASKESEFYDEVPYPEIKPFPLDYRTRKTENRQTRFEKIKKLETIEEKMIEINMPRYYGFKSIKMSDHFPYNPLPNVQYYTNTEFVEEQSLVDSEDSTKIDEFLKLIKSEVIDAFEFEIDGYKHAFDIKDSKLDEQAKERARTGGIVRQLNRVLINALGADNHHLQECDVDLDPRHEAHWFVGGIEPPHRIKMLIKGIERIKEFADDPVERSFHYQGQPLLALRHLHPLLPFEDIDFDSMTAKNEKIPKMKIDPRKYGFLAEHRHGTEIPGFWPGNVREYGLTSFHDRHMNSIRNPDYGAVDQAEALHAQGILSSFAWLHAQAFYNGFTTYNDLTYPLPTQSVITDGKFWSFYKYQMNTTITHIDEYPDHFKYNKCWGTKEMKLYDTIEDGKLKGLNDEVLKNLLTFYLNQPVPREHAMKPFLGEKVKKVADLENLDQRAWLEKHYKHLVANRPRKHAPPEIYNWEWIYKIRFNTRPLDKKLRFFELGINPFKRELDEHKPEYIPKKFRARGIHDKLRYKSVYYPEAHNHYIPREIPWKAYGAPKNEFAKLMDKRRKSYK